MEDMGSEDTNVDTPDLENDVAVDLSECVDCLYTPDETFTVSSPVTFDSLSYTDVLGETRRLAVAVFRPMGVTEPAPLILLSHGGSAGKTDPLKSMDKWAPIFAASGYIAVAIAHPGRDEASYNALCDEVGFTSTAIMCAIKIDWDRPYDVATVLDWLEARTAPGEPLEGRIDWTKVGHVGHSAGAGAGMMLAGVSRNYVCAQPFGFDQGSVVACDPANLERRREERIKAVVVMSPQGPGQAGFMTESFANVEIPLLMGTGANDGDDGEPENRKLVYDSISSSTSGDEVGRVFLEGVGAKHTLFEGETDACVNTGTPLARCEEMRRWLFSVGVAWMDTHLRQSDRARDWLRSDQFGQVTANAGILDLK
jgi:predicted dienelactone hydrolase